VHLPLNIAFEIKMDINDSNQNTTRPPVAENPQAPAAATAATTAPKASTCESYNDATIAQTLQTLDQLTSIFKFEPSVAQLAIENVGPADPTACYNYIIDQGLAEDCGGPIIPKSNCPHVGKHVLVTRESLNFNDTCRYVDEERNAAKKRGGLKEDVSEDGKCPRGENWLCLDCGVTRCSRYINGHCKTHWENTKAEARHNDDTAVGHCIAVSLTDLSVWCYECNAYLSHSKLTPLVKKLEEIKFGIEGQNMDEEKNDSFGYENGDISQDNDDSIEHNGVKEEEGNDHRYIDGLDNEKNEHKKHKKNTEQSCASLEHKAASVASVHEAKEGEGENDQYSNGLDDNEIPYLFFNERNPNVPNSLKDLAQFIKSDKCRSIIILAGAGMSLASGIPDFRSSGGLYDTLKPELLTATPLERYTMSLDPTYVLEKTLFLNNSLPCLEVNRPFILGTQQQKWKATLAHRFIEMLHYKTNKLTRLYTQNIDGLEGHCKKLPKSKVIPVHGSMDRVACEICGTKMNFDEFCTLVQSQIKDISGKDIAAPLQSTPIKCATCDRATLKPTIVLFRSPLPKEFFECMAKDLPNVDLLLILGTSLAVAPANQLVPLVPTTAVRVVINREPVGYMLGINYEKNAERDFFAKGNCEDVVLDLMEELGWIEDLDPESLPEGSRDLLLNHFRLSKAGIDKKL